MHSTLSIKSQKGGERGITFVLSGIKRTKKAASEQPSLH